MNTMRTTAVAAGILILAGCGSSHGGTAQSPSAPAPRPAVVTTTPASAPAATQPIDDWLPAATSVLSDLTTDLHGITAKITSDPSSVPTDPDVARLAADARTGLRLKAPAGYPGVDRAWDQVMNDYLHVSVALEEDNTDQATVDLNTATADTGVLQAELPSS